MISKDIEPAKPVVQSEGQIGDKPCFRVTENSLEITQISYGRIVDDGGFIVEMERALERILIRDCSDDNNEGRREPARGIGQPTMERAFRRVVVCPPFLAHPAPITGLPVDEVAGAP